MLKSIAFLCGLVGVSACGPRPAALSDAASSPSADHPRDEAFVYVKAPLDLVSPSWVAATGFQRDHAVLRDHALGYLPRAAWDAMDAADKGRLVTLDAWDVATGRLDPVTLKVHAVDDGAGESVFGDVEDYHDYEALTSELQAMAAAHPGLMRLESAGTSVQGRQLWLARVTSDVGAAEKPKLLYIANMHGDEVVGRELMIYHLRRLLTEYGKDERVTRLVDNAEIFVMPSMNPDGFALKQRYSAARLDLNRNFPDFTSDDHDDPRGRGVETQAVMALHERHHFLAAINFHGGSVCFNLPWDTKPNRSASEKFGDDALLRTMGRAYIDQNPTMRDNHGGSFDHGLTYGYEWYEVDGGMQDWSIYYRQSMHATVELTYTKWPSKSQLPKAWNENKEALLGYMERALFGVHLRAVDEDGNPVAGVSAALASAQRTVRYPGAVVHRPTLEGTQSVTLSAPGHASATVRVEPDMFQGEYQDVVLKAN